MKGREQGRRAIISKLPGGNPGRAEGDHAGTRRVEKSRVAEEDKRWAFNGAWDHGKTTADLCRRCYSICAFTQYKRS
jgi:hypothetical protein